MVPLVKLFDVGVLNEVVLRIVACNLRMLESLAGDIDVECAVMCMGVWRVEELFDCYGCVVVEVCFDVIIFNIIEMFCCEVFLKIFDGVYEWEDYVEYDGVDLLCLHVQWMMLTKRDDCLLIDFIGIDL